MKKYLLIFIFCLAAQTALAANFYVPLGSKPGATSGIVSLVITDTIEVSAKKDHSVYCRPRATTAGGDWGLTNSISCPFLDCSSFTGRLTGDVDAGVDRSDTSNDSISFTAPISTVFSFPINDVNPNPVTLVPECFDTTLLGNFNTINAANPFNFLELTNDSDTAITTLIVITKNDGTEISRTSVAIPAEQQKDISIHDIAGASNTFGKISVAHDGALHGLRGNISKYRLDGSSFVITASVPLNTRGNEQ